MCNTNKEGGVGIVIIKYYDDDKNITDVDIFLGNNLLHLSINDWNALKKLIKHEVDTTK